MPRRLERGFRRISARMRFRLYLKGTRTMMSLNPKTLKP